jgi:hypothetical protein
MYFTVDAASTLTAVLNDPGGATDHFSESVTLSNASNTALLFGSGTTTVPPGTYHLDFSMGAFRAAGTGGSGSSDYTLTQTPEPGGIGLLMVAAMLMRRRGHG